MKRTSKRNIKIAAATSMAIFSLMVTFSATYAWYTAMRHVEQTGDDFEVDVIKTSVKKITVHEFLGETQTYDAYTFNPNGSIAYDPSLAGTTGYDENGFYTAESYIRLHEYSIESPNHPVLMMFEVDGLSQRIDLTTDYTFLGNDKPSVIKTQVTTKAALDALNKTSYSAGDYFEVLTDESHSNQCTLYYYNGSSVEYATIDNFAGLDVAANKIANRHTKVLTDEDHGGVSTIYKYDGITSTFTMVWMDLGDFSSGKTNPLSSAVQFNVLTYDKEDYATLNDMVTTKDIIKETANSDGEIISLVNQNSQSCLSIDKSLLTVSNQKSFTNFTDNYSYEYHNDINLFDDDVREKSYIAVVINYNYYALEYVFSNNLGHFALNEGLQFVCDWTTRF